ncbi:MAG: glycoside hydrolase domain-containing protein, partial [Gemmatimonadales bacterium]
MSSVSCRRAVPAIVALSLSLLPAMLPAQGAPAEVGRWNADSLGNHRARVRVTAAGEAARVHLPWRRRDTEPEQKRVIVTTASGVRARNVAVGDLTREAGDIAFEPVDGPGEYFVYYMPYEGSVRSNYPRITYQKPDSSADRRWVERYALTRGGAGWHSVPSAEVMAFEAVDSMSRMDPMELIATAAETGALRAKHAGRAFLAFPEDRSRSIRMTDDLPQRWIADGPDGPV